MQVKDIFIVYVNVLLWLKSAVEWKTTSRNLKEGICTSKGVLLPPSNRNRRTVVVNRTNIYILARSTDNYSDLLSGCAGDLVSEG